MLCLRICHPFVVAWHEIDQTTGCLERLAHRGEGGKGRLHAARDERVQGNDQVRFWSAFHHTLRLIIELTLDCVILGENHEHARKRWITVGELLAYVHAVRSNARPGHTLLAWSPREDGKRLAPGLRGIVRRPGPRLRRAGAAIQSLRWRFGL